MRVGRPVAFILWALLLPAPSPAAEKLDGYAEFQDGYVIIVDGQRVRADDKTRYKTDYGLRNLWSISLGWEVEVKGRRLEDGSVQATRVEARQNQETSVETEIKQTCDRMERLYRKNGRMADTDANGRVVANHGRLLTRGPQVERVTRIMARLVPPYLSAADLRVYVVENPEWNAMAAPNYSIYVFSGLLEAMDDDEVAIVLGHELAHATHEHSRKQYNRGMWVQMGAAAAAGLAGDISNSMARTGAEYGTMLAASAVSTGYSRDHEDQADRVGLRYAYEGGYDVSKGPELWKRFSAKYGDTDVVVNFFFGEHSRSGKRAELLQEEIRLNYREPKPSSATSP